jgi:hypothetical protein
MRPSKSHQWWSRRPGPIVVNAVQLTMFDDFSNVIRVAPETRLDVFVGVVVPEVRGASFLSEIDDALAGRS